MRLPKIESFEINTFIPLAQTATCIAVTGVMRLLNNTTAVIRHLDIRSALVFGLAAAIADEVAQTRFKEYTLFGLLGAFTFGVATHKFIFNRDPLIDLQSAVIIFGLMHAIRYLINYTKNPENSTPTRIIQPDTIHVIQEDPQASIIIEQPATSTIGHPATSPVTVLAKSNETAGNYTLVEVKKPNNITN